MLQGLNLRRRQKMIAPPWAQCVRFREPVGLPLGYNAFYQIKNRPRRFTLRSVMFFSKTYLQFVLFFDFADLVPLVLLLTDLVPVVLVFCAIFYLPPYVFGK